MLNDIIAYSATFLYFSFVALTVQNVVFTRALGISRLISLLDDTTDTIVFGVLLTITMLANSLANYFIQQLFLSVSPYADYLRPLCMVVCMIAIFFVMFFLCAKLSPQKYLQKSVQALPVATFNCMVVGTVLLSFANNLTLGKTLGFALGSSLGFVLAVLIVTEVQRKLQSSSVPPAFKGLPATLLFLSALSLAIYGLTGFQLSF